VPFGSAKRYNAERREVLPSTGFTIPLYHREKQCNPRRENNLLMQLISRSTDVAERRVHRS
jgi:hypothetical protein